MNARLRPQLIAGIHWVRGELEQSIARARTLIDHYAETGTDPLQLQQAYVELHQVRGTAVMIQCYGLAIAAGEMAAALQDLSQNRIAEPQPLYSALLGATIQLSDYVQALAEGTTDCVLVLQPTINELRLARGQPVLTEAELFVLQMQGLDKRLPAPGAPVASVSEGIQREARRLLATFQASLLAWIRGGADAKTGAARVGKIAELIAQQATDAAVHQLWRIAAAAIEAYLGRGIRDALELMRLFGRLGVQLKLLATSGESAAAAQMGDLPLQLLFFVGRSTSRGTRVQALRTAFDLDHQLPDPATLDQLRRRIHGPNTALLVKVAEEIRAEFARVKDQIDLIVRTGSGDGAATVAGLKRIADTLSALGLGRLHQVIVNQSRMLAGGEAQGSIDASVWMDLATSILRVENDLEDALFRQMQHADDPAALDISTDVPASRDLAEGREALYREFLVNLARVKTAIDAYLKSSGTAALPDAVLLIDEIASGFEMLSQARAAELMRRLRRFAAGRSLVRLREDAGRAERFADAVAAVEYYIESVRSALPGADAILDDLTRALDALEAGLEAGEPETVAPPPAAVSEPALTATASPAAAAAGEDPEIREIFLEEAAEVQATARNAFAAWSRDPQNRDALTTLRRAFHTLKGSGRTVGATEIGEFGWAIENMLNKCLDGSVTISPGIVETVGRALALLPALVEAFRTHAPSPADAASVAEHAREYAAGRTPGAEPEADMVQVFRDDANEKLASVAAWLDEHTQEGEVAPDAGIVRAFHTIRGAARIVEASALSELAGALETYLDHLAEARLRFDADSLQLLRESTATLRAWIAEVGTPAVARQDAAPWLARIETLRSSVLPEGAAQASAERELHEIFAGEAFDLVAKIEDQLRGWAQAPDNVRAAAELKLLSHTLLGAAQMSGCSGIAEVARALHRAFDGAAQRALVPEAEAFTQLLAVCEGLYQYLDRFREGRLQGDDDGWAARVEALDWAMSLPAFAAAAPAVAAPPPQSESIELTFDALQLDAPPAVSASTDPLQSAPALEAVVPPPLASGDAEPLPERTIGLAEESIEIPPVESPEMATDGVDAELLTVFLTEAEELLESLDQSSAALERDPHNLALLAEIKRLLHTFKGSARVTGLRTIAEVAHRLETLFENLEAGRVPPGTHFFARVQNALDGLQLALDDIKRGVIPEPLALLDELALPLAAEPAVPAAAPPAPQARPEPARALPEGLDLELAQTFAGEAEELMDILESALQRWQALPGDFTPARDMLRALHTYKGGARMAGLVAMGDAAHELESLIEGLEYAGELDAGALRVVAAAVAELRTLTDRLQRGEYDTLVDAAHEVQADERSPAPVLTSVTAGADAPRQISRAQPESVPVPVEPASPPAGVWDPLLFWRPEQEEEGLAAQRRETARVPVEVLDRLLNEAGEISIYRSRIEEHNTAIQAQLEDMAQAIQRVRDQLRQLDIETEAQIAARGFHQTEGADRYAGEFDPLEMDRYTRMQELSRALSESIGDLAAVHASIDQLASEQTTILLQQGRVNTEVQQGLMRTLMVPFSRQVARLQRVVQQTAMEHGKRVDIVFDGVEAELDRNVLERMTAPLEHLLRNAVIHGIEPPAQREAAGKPANGRLTLRLWREGSQLFIELADDGRGLDLAAIRETAIRRGLMPADAEITDDEAAQFIFVPGFSTARQLTQDAGRGVGMDVVAAEVKQLGGNIELASETGKGARFKLRLPLTLAMSQSLLVGVGHELYAAPLASIEGITRVPRERLDAYLADDGPELEYADQHYRVHHLADLVGLPREGSGDGRTAHALLVRMPESIGGEIRRVAVIVDQLIGSRQIVSKAVGPQISTIPGITGATILADGRVVLILDIATLVQDRTRRALRTQVMSAQGEPLAEAQRTLIMVVDDSITIRRVTERLLAKHGYAVITAKDGLDAMAQLQTERPDAILLDIEMPRADGFEVATFVRNSAPIARTPILMITSRSGDKHRERAAAIGVDRYLIKPYQEDQLLGELSAVLEERRA
ncbi:chemosensory pili system protein ChpA (sensor histidine kinase/response regulator) [Fontimonas thermophila]|uniref:Chemotaxis protein CheA n=1 Tax=Fontimonas thermophila TaxID=1076937 RepID=A0A1I2JL84_9GAMM|nr:hybrid sensor histidine kinase/response regulator [Fontimonas thermophila]SFF54878.1 chemosensory pili system protein ChpA (sensor histidine kinase/response regulator) [Fontimonas thermophila]